jgi:hypothetical protein
MKVIPTLRNYVKKGVDTYYCATVQIVWDKLRDLLLINDIIVTPNQYSQELNRFRYPITMLDEGRYIAVAGLVPGVFDIIESEMMRKFGEIKVDVRSIVPGNTFYTAFAYLNKLLRFDVPFKEYADSIVFNSNTFQVPVKMFGYNAHTENEVFIYKFNEALALRITTMTDTIIFTKLLYANTLDTLVSEAAVVRNYGHKLEPAEIGKVAIPYLSFDSSNEFPEVCGPILNAVPYSIDRFIENTKFALDEYGVKLESYAVIFGSGSAGMHSVEQDVIFDSPFLVEMYDNLDTKLENPYFVYYVQTTENMKVVDTINNSNNN